MVTGRNRALRLSGSSEQRKRKKRLFSPSPTDIDIASPLLWFALTCTSSVSRVHRDEVSDRGSEVDLLTQELKSRLVQIERGLDGLQLRGHHGQHLHVDSIELIEAAPCASLNETGEDGAHRLVIQTLAAV